MSARETTADQARWFRRLQRCIKDMPPDTAILVRHGSVEMIHPQDRAESFEQWGCLDRCPILDTFAVRSRKVEPAGEGL